jgi:CheY-like chemotaxis protein
MSPVLEQTQTTLAEAVLIVEDDDRTANQFLRLVESNHVYCTIASNTSEASRKLNLLLQRGIQRLVILLDLMFEQDDPREGINFLQDISRLPEFGAGRINIIVLTGDDDAETREEALSNGAREFYVKAVDPSPVVRDILAYLNKDVRVAMSLLEIVDIDDSGREMEVRYKTPQGTSVRCTLDSQVAPIAARVPGGSFWFDVYKRFDDGQMLFQFRCRPVNREKDADALRKFLGTP